MELRVAAYGVITDPEQRLLLAHWNEGAHHAWTLPGGGLEAGEDPESALVREIREETGYRARVGGILGVHSRVLPANRRIVETDQPLHTIRLVYRAEVIGGRLRDEIDGSTDHAQWFTLNEVKTLKRVKLITTALKWAELSVKG